MNTFLKVTGPKTDLWLVKTVGIILAIIGAVLSFGYISAQINSSVVFLAIGSALSLAIVEFVYVVKRVISPIYLADAVIELAILAWWLLDIFVLKTSLT
jgi:hypothetical protein